MSDQIQFDNLQDAAQHIKKLEGEVERLKDQLRLVHRLGDSCRVGVGDGPIACVLYFHSKLGRTHRQAVEKSLLQCWHRSASQLYVMAPESLDGPVTQAVRVFGSSIQIVQTFHKPSSVHLHSPTASPSEVQSKVEYYYQFCVDSFGLPVQDLGGEMVPLYTSPQYTQLYTSEVWADEGSSKPRRQQKKCWNCDGDHDLKSCPRPLNQARVQARRMEFMQRTPTSDRYATAPDERFANFKPGVISDTLGRALGLRKGEVPEYIYRMHELGYPPGYKLAGSNWSGMSVYDEHQNSADDGRSSKSMATEENEVMYPGFNAPMDYRPPAAGPNQGQRSSVVQPPLEDMDISDHDEIEEGEITELDKETVTARPSEATQVLSEDASRTDCGTTATDGQERGSPVTGGTTPRKQFSMDFPPDVMQLVVESEGIPKRWTNIKGILDRGRR